MYRLGCIASVVIFGTALLGADVPAAGSIQGVVRFTGQLPPVQIITTSEGGKLEHHDLVVDARTKGLRHVFVSLEDAPAQAKVANAKPVLMDQKDMLFLPRVVAVQHGQAVRFDNSDLCNHSVMAVSTVAANQLNVFVTPTKPIEHVFEPQKRPVLIGCSLHGWMRAWVYAVPHPWFALTDAEGKFQIAGIPPGKYTLLCHHADTGLQERRTVQVQAGKTTTLQLDWEKAPGK
jgi:plastocyanin